MCLHFTTKKERTTNYAFTNTKYVIILAVMALLLLASKTVIGSWGVHSVSSQMRTRKLGLDDGSIDESIDEVFANDHSLDRLNMSAIEQNKRASTGRRLRSRPRPHCPGAERCASCRRIFSSPASMDAIHTVQTPTTTASSSNQYGGRK